MINRTEANRALAKAIAYKNCGKDKMATAWAAHLMHLLQCSNILSEGFANEAQVKDVLRYDQNGQ